MNKSVVSTSTHLSTSLQRDAGEARASLVDCAEKVAEQGTVLDMQLFEIVVMDIRGPECMSYILADILDGLNDGLLGVEEVQGYELDSGISLEDLEWFTRGDDNSRPVALSDANLARVLEQGKVTISRMAP